MTHPGLYFDGAIQGRTWRATQPSLWSRVCFQRRPVAEACGSTEMFPQAKGFFSSNTFLTPLTSNEVWPYRHWNTKYARQRANCLKADPNGGATAWKLTVSARCTPTDKRSRLKRKEIHMFTITILCCIRKKNSKDVQNGWPSKCCSSSTNNPGFLIEITKGNIWKKAALIS